MSVSKPPEEAPSSDAPFLLIKGEATDEEVAALVAVLQGIAASTAAATASQETPAVSEWGSPHRKVRTAYPHGPGGWRASALPR